MNPQFPSEGLKTAKCRRLWVNKFKKKFFTAQSIEFTFNIMKKSLKLQIRMHERSISQTAHPVLSNFECVLQGKGAP